MTKLLDLPVLRSWWFNRFQMRQELDGTWHFRDSLFPPGRKVQEQVFAEFKGRHKEVAYFRLGFMHAAISASRAVTGSPSYLHDDLFWQFPCRTEGAALDVHSRIQHPLLSNDDMHVYLGLPWATWIDKGRKDAWGPDGPSPMRHQLRICEIRLSGLRGALAALGVRLRVHTVCQHIYWRDMLGMSQQLGVTDLWLSHCPSDPTVNSQGCSLHPWALFAVNVEDPTRSIGIVLGKDPAERPVLASFIGAHAPHYLSDVRLRLRNLAHEPGWVVRITDRWHFEEVVYEHQIAGKPLSNPTSTDESVGRYNRLLSDSVFALCPAGAGANTLRLWEALAVGAVPVLLGNQPMLPEGGTLPAVDWERIVLRVSDEEMSSLPKRLLAMPMSERRERQRLGMQAYEMVKAQRCF